MQKHPGTPLATTLWRRTKRDDRKFRNWVILNLQKYLNVASQMLHSQHTSIKHPIDPNSHYLSLFLLRNLYHAVLARFDSRKWTWNCWISEHLEQFHSSRTNLSCTESRYYNFVFKTSSMKFFAPTLGGSLKRFMRDKILT